MGASLRWLERTPAKREVDGSSPVSYTHLDVYKRQGIYTKLCSLKYTPNTVAAAGSYAFSIIFMPNVSTENRDVYKRQYVCSPGHKGHDDLTSSPPSSVLSTAVSLECSCVATNDKGCARCGT